MSTTTSTTPPTQALHATPAPSPKKAFGPTDAQPIQASSPAKCCYCQLDLLFSPTVPHPPASSVQLQLPSTTDSDYDTNSIEEAEDEYTLSAYGDISLSEVIVPPLPSPHPDPDGSQPKIPQPRLRLKVQRPPMPKRRLSYVHVPDPLPRFGGIDSDERWPGSPRSIANNSSRFQHQPLVSPFPVGPASLQRQGNKSGKNGAPSLERLADELLLRSPSIRLSPPGSSAIQALSLSQERHRQRNVQQGGELPKANDAAVKPSQSPPAPVRQQEKPWRTRLPPRPPIPKWDT